MANRAAQGTAPIGFTNDKGAQVLVPLSSLAFDDKGQVVLPAPYNADAGLKTWVNYLVQSGAVTPAPAPAPRPALVLQAATPGAAGNQITATVSAVTPDAKDATQGTFTLKAAATSAWAGLTPDTLAAVVGTISDVKDKAATVTTPGSQPGLVLVLAGGPFTLPAEVAGQPLANSDEAKKVRASLDVPDNADPTKTAFTLVAASGGQAGESVQVTVKVSKPAGGKATFDLTCTWAGTAAKVSTQDLTPVAKNLGYLLTAAAPAGGAALLPAAGAAQLQGGAETQAARPASATLVANG